MLLVFFVEFRCRRCWRRDKPSLVQRSVLALVGKFVANVYPRCSRMSFKWVSVGNGDFCGALGRALGDVCGEIPPPMCGGGLSICIIACCDFRNLMLQVHMLLGRTSVRPIIFVFSGALNIKFSIWLLVSVPCRCTSQAGCAETVRLHNHTYGAAPANAGLGLAILIR